MARNGDKSSIDPALLNSADLINRVSLDVDPEVRFLNSSLMYFDDQRTTDDKIRKISKKERAEFNSSEVVKNLLANFLDSVCPFIESKLSANQI